MRNYRSLLFLLLLFNPPGINRDLYGQSKMFFSGSVIDSATKSMVNGATVLLLYHDSIISYGFSDANGQYRFEAELNYGSTVMLSCRHISYLSVSKSIAAQNLHNEVDFILTPSSKTLSEVLISSKRVVENDTIEFSIQNINTVKTKKVEDLIKGLPGFEVLKNGQLKYNDRDVYAVLLNGDNLSGSNYGVITRNLDANAIQKIQVINNFSENRIIGSIFKSGDIALNLVTRDELEGKFDGSTELGTSFFKHYRASVDLVAIKKTMQALAFIGANDIGEDNNPSFNIKSNNKLTTDQPGEVAYFKTTPVNSYKNSQISDHYLPNEKRITVFPTISIPLSKKMKLLERISFKSYKSTTSLNQSSNTRISDHEFYNLVSSSSSNNDMGDVENATTLKFDNAKRLAFEVSFSYSNRYSKNNFIQKQSGDYIDSLKSQSSIPFSKYAVSGAGAYLLAPKKALGYSFTAYYLTDKGSISFETNRFEDYFNQPVFNRFLKQKVEQKNKVIIGNLFYLKKTIRGSNTVKFSNVYYQNSIFRNIIADSNANFSKFVPITAGNKQLTFNKTALEFISTYKNYSNQHLELYATVGMYNMIDPFHKYYFHYSVSGSTSGHFKNAINYSVSLGSNRFIGAPELLLKDSLIEAVSLIRLATRGYEPISVHGAELSLERKGWVNYNLKYSFRWFSKNFESVLQYDPRLTLYYMQSFSGGTRHRIELVAKTYSLKLKGTIYVNAQYRHERSNGELNGVVVGRVINSINSSLRYVSNFKTMYNFELSYTHGLIRYGQRGTDRLNSKSSNDMFYLSQRLDISKSIFIGFAYNYYRFGFGNFSQADIFSTWQIATSTRINLMGINVFNQKSYRTQFNDVNNEFKMETPVAKPYVLFSVQQQF